MVRIHYPLMYLFQMLSLLLLISSIMVITSVNPIQSIFWLVLCFINGSGIIISLGLDFLPLMLIVIYVGSIVILFLFVIMMLDLHQFKMIPVINIVPVLMLMVVIILARVSIFEDLKSMEVDNQMLNFWSFKNDNDLGFIGSLLYNYLCVPLLVITTLLLVALVGVIILGLETSEKRKQDLSLQQRRNNSWI